jgi:hypothetical protein
VSLARASVTLHAPTAVCTVCVRPVSAALNAVMAGAVFDNVPAQLAAVTWSLINVTAPSRASARPCTVTPSPIEIDVVATMLPAKVEEAPSVAELPTVQMFDLLEMTADCACDDGPGLPHRLSHSEAEPLLQTLLDHDRGQVLDRVDHRVVLVGRAEREAGEMNPRARRGRQSPPAFADLSEHGCCFGVIGDLAWVGAREQQVRVGRL